MFENKRAELEKKISESDMEKIKERALKKVMGGITNTDKEKNISFSREQLQREIEKEKNAYLNSITMSAVDKMIKKDIGQRMRKIREKNRKSQEDVIADFGFVPDMKKSVLSRWENGERGINYFFLLWFIDEYNETYQYLLTGEKKEPLSRVVPELQKVLEEMLEISHKM